MLPQRVVYQQQPPQSRYYATPIPSQRPPYGLPQYPPFARASNQPIHNYQPNQSQIVLTQYPQKTQMAESLKPMHNQNAPQLYTPQQPQKPIQYQQQPNPDQFLKEPLQFNENPNRTVKYPAGFPISQLPPQAKQVLQQKTEQKVSPQPQSPVELKAPVQLQHPSMNYQNVPSTQLYAQQSQPPVKKDSFNNNGPSQNEDMHKRLQQMDDILKKSAEVIQACKKVGNNWGIQAKDQKQYIPCEINQPTTSINTNQLNNVYISPKEQPEADQEAPQDYMNEYNGNEPEQGNEATDGNQDNGSGENPGGEDGVQTEYEGQTLNDMRHGQGILKIKDSDQVIYEGSWYDDQYHGSGALYNIFFKQIEDENFNYCNLDQYEEQWYCYQGEFENGIFHGEGTLVYPNGYKFQGTFENGKANGSGKIFDDEDRVVYQGVWEDNRTNYQ